MPRKRQGDKSPIPLEDFSKFDEARKGQLKSISLNLANSLYEQEMELTIFDCGYNGICECPLDSDARNQLEPYLYVLSVFRERAIAEIECLSDEVKELGRLLSEL